VAFAAGKLAVSGMPQSIAPTGSASKARQAERAALAEHRPRFQAEGGHGAASALALGLVEGLVGTAQRVVERFAVVHLHDAEAQAQRRMRGCDLAVGQAGDDSRGHGHRVVDAGAGQQHGELVAAQAPGHIGRAQRVAHAARHLAQRLVAGGMAEQVVDALEVVDIEHHQRARRRSAGLEHARGQFVEVPAVGHAGQHVDVSQVAQLAVHRAQVGFGPFVGQHQCEVDHHQRRHHDHQPAGQQHAVAGGAVDAVGQSQAQADGLHRSAREFHRHQQLHRAAFAQFDHAREHQGAVQVQRAGARGEGGHAGGQRAVGGPRGQPDQIGQREQQPVERLRHARGVAKAETAHASQHHDRPLQQQQVAQRQQFRRAVAEQVQQAAHCEQPLRRHPPAVAAVGALRETVQRHHRGRSGQRGDADGHQGGQVQAHGSSRGCGILDLSVLLRVTSLGGFN